MISDNTIKLLSIEDIQFLPDRFWMLRLEMLIIKAGF
jgi:hypothetical protein